MSLWLVAVIGLCLISCAPKPGWVRLVRIGPQDAIICLEQAVPRGTLFLNGNLLRPPIVLRATAHSLSANGWVVFQDSTWKTAPKPGSLIMNGWISGELVDPQLLVALRDPLVVGHDCIRQVPRLAQVLEAGDIVLFSQKEIRIIPHDLAPEAKKMWLALGRDRVPDRKILKALDLPNNFIYQLWHPQPLRRIKQPECD